MAPGTSLNNHVESKQGQALIVFNVQKSSVSNSQQPTPNALLPTNLYETHQVLSNSIGNFHDAISVQLGLLLRAQVVVNDCEDDREPLVWTLISGRGMAVCRVNEGFGNLLTIKVDGFGLRCARRMGE